MRHLKKKGHISTMKKAYLVLNLEDLQGGHLIPRSGAQILSAHALKELVFPSLPTLEGGLSLAAGRPGLRAVKDFMYAAAVHQASLGATIVVEDSSLSNIDRQREWFQLLEPYGYQVSFLADEDIPVHPLLGRVDAQQMLSEGVLSVENIQEGWEVMVVGDVQSAGSRIQKLIDNRDHERMLWVFVGDLFDRGDNPALVHSLISHLGRRARRVLGDHDWNIRKVLREPQGTTKRQTRETLEILEREKNMHPATLKKWVAGFTPAFDFVMPDGRRYLVTHAGVGLDSLPLVGEQVNLHATPDVFFMLGERGASSTYAGIGDYPASVDTRLAELSASQGLWVGQLHGHREAEAPGSVPSVFGLESSAETPEGRLTAALVSADGVEVIEVF